MEEELKKQKERGIEEDIDLAYSAMMKRWETEKHEYLQ